MDSNEFIKNRSAHTAEELAPYEEQYVAWSEDGKQILAHATDREDLYREIDRLGLKSYVIGFVPDPEISCLGGSDLWFDDELLPADQDPGP
jgi:hypothetical protein